MIPKAGFPLGEFVRANREKSNLVGWRQTLTTSPANHIRFLLVRANKFAKWKTGFNYVNRSFSVSSLEVEISVVAIKAVFHCSRFARAGGANMF